MHPIMWFIVGLIGIPVALLLLVVALIITMIFPFIVVGLVMMWAGVLPISLSTMMLLAGMNVLYLIVAVYSNPIIGD